MVNDPRDIDTYEHLKTSQPSAADPGHSFVLKNRPLTVQQFSQLTFLDHFVQRAPTRKPLDDEPAGVRVDLGHIQVCILPREMALLEQGLRLRLRSMLHFLSHPRLVQRS